MKIVVIPGLFLSGRGGRRVVQNVAVTQSAENITVKLKLLPGPEGLFVPGQVGEVLVLEVEQVKAGAEERGLAMAYKILETCGCCGICVTECR